MEIPQNLSIENRLAQRAAEEETAPGELGRQAFLELLISQLENQDPMAPLKDHEFVAQLATFSSLEQLEGINQGMQTNLLMNQSVNNSLATTLIGKEVLASGSQLSLGEEGDVSFQLQVAADANVQVLIRDAEGNLVRTLDQGDLEAGSTTVKWDGMTESGTRAGAGEYTVDIVATNSEGLPVPVDARMRARVDGVSFDDGTAYLLVNGTKIPISDVVEVLG